MEDGIKIFIWIVVLFAMFVGLVHEVETHHDEQLKIAQELVNKQMTPDMSFENKINIISKSCVFVFGIKGGSTRCNEELLLVFEMNK